MRMRSDWQCIVLDRIRLTINLLKKSNVFNAPSATGEESVLTTLKELQNELRYDREDACTPKMVVAPFLQVLRSSNVSGPFILSAVESLQHFVSNSILLSGPESVEEVLEDIVDAVMNCKFIHTSPDIDILAQRQLVELARILTTHFETAAYLSLEALWKIFDFANTTMIASGGSSKARSVYHSAKGLVTGLIDYLLLCICHDGAYGSSSRQLKTVSSGLYLNGGEKGDESKLNSTRRHFDTITALCWFVTHFISVMNGYCTEEPDLPPPPPLPSLDSSRMMTPTPPPHGKHYTANASPRPSTPIAFGKSPSQAQHLNDLAQENEVQHVLFCMKMIQKVLLAHGNGSTMKKLMIMSVHFYNLVSDDLGLSLLTLCNTRRSASSTEIIHMALMIFSALANSTGTTLRIIVERFVRQVYIKALIQVHSWFTTQVNSHTVIGGYPFPYTTPSLRPQKSESNLSLDAVAVSAESAPLEYVDNFRTPVVEVILESLCDLMSDLSFVPSLYVSFDCNPSALDIVQPMVDYLCRSCCLVLTHSAELMTGSSKEVGILVIQVFKQLSMALSARVAGRDKIYFEQTYSAVPPPAPPALAAGGSQPPSPGHQLDSAVVGDQYNVDSQIPPTTKVAQIMKACRQSKYLLLEAARLFSEKPEKGFRFLQALGALPTPLTASSVTKFLRTATGLPKNLVGSFLGELGDDNANHESKSKELHSQVLIEYVRSFDFNGQPTLDCLRTFLSAFRLPGEAQQIDRILVAFSEYCHAHSQEGTSGLLENSEVTYLLTFSMIMLNTDRHNPNIRDDRRMTKEQFVRNNTNYGRDVNQTIPIPRDYLEAVFYSIDKNPIRTEEEEISSFVTNEEWMDYHMQATADHRKRILLSTDADTKYVRELAAEEGIVCDDWASSERVTEVWRELAAHGDAKSDDNRNGKSSASINASAVVKKILSEGDCPPTVFHPLELCLAIEDIHWLFDCDLLGCIWKHLLRVSTCVHIHHYLIMVQIMRLDGNAKDSGEQVSLEKIPSLKKGQLRRLLDISNEFLFELLKVANGYNQHYVLDYSAMLLISCTGLMTGELCEKIFKQLLWESSISSSGNQMDAMQFPFIDARSAATFDPTILLQQLYFFESVRSSMVTALTLVHEYQASVRCWGTIFFFLSCLHDCALLPEDMVVEVDADLLPPHVRDEFEMKLLELERKRVIDARPTPSKRTKKSASILSLQGLGEALFGSSAEINQLDQYNDLKSDEVSSSEGPAAVINADDMSMEEMLIMKMDALSARWDAGYELQTSNLSEETKGLRTMSSESIATQDGAEQSGFFSVGDAVKEIRSHSGRSGIVNLVSGTRFFSEVKLTHFLKALIRVSEVKEDHGIDPTSGISEDGKGEFTTYSLEPLHYAQTAAHVLDNTECFNRMVLVLCNECESSVYVSHYFSTSSIAWLEMLLVEVSLRNRDRFSIVWPHLKRHYIYGLSGIQVALSYVTERRVTGLMKISARLLGRETFTSTILEFLGQLLALRKVGTKRRCDDSENEDADVITPVSKPDHISPIPSSIMQALSDQISAGMWTVLTLNVERLPFLLLEQWQTIFNIVALGASSGSFAAIKSFEAMAWLLHEPRLLAKVPVFCIIGIKPLIRNSQAPLSVSIGAVHLLSHLHSRLEVLIKDESGNIVDTEDANAEGDIWDSCWTPILRALVEGVNDVRPPVQEACVDALCQAIVDKHAAAVPSGILMNVLGDIFAPVLIQVGDFGLTKINKELPHGSKLPLSSQILEFSVEIEQPKNNSHKAQLPEWLLRGSKERNTLELCLTALCTSFKLYLKKLSSYPSFDKLWLRMLSIFGYLIEAAWNVRELLTSAVPATLEFSTEARNYCCTINKMKECAIEQLEKLLVILEDNEIFRKRPGLSTVTKSTMQQFHGCFHLLK